MTGPILPLATSTWDAAEYAAIDRVVASGRFTMGPLVEQFEHDFAEQVGAAHAVMVNSGSSANLLAVAAAVLDPDIDLAAGDEVIVPAVSWATTYFPLQQYGLRLRFVDIDPRTLNFDLDAVAAAIGPRTKAILAVNLLGNPIDFDRLTALVDGAGLVLIIDNCESLGATFAGREAGTFGVMGTYSTFFSHHIATMEGGLIVTDSERTRQHLVSLRAHGWTRGLPDRNEVHDKTGDPFEDSFRFVLPGYNVRPLEMSGAIGIEQVPKIDPIVAGRRSNAEHWQSVMGGVADVRLQQETGKSSWFGFSMVLEGRLAGRRHELVEVLAAAGVESRPIVAGNFTRNPAMAYLDAIVPESLPVADEIHDNGLFIGNHQHDVSAGLDRVAEVVATMA